VGPKAGVDALEKISLVALPHNFSVLQPADFQCTDYSIYTAWEGLNEVLLSKTECLKNSHF